ncbi:MAG: type II toxin-antitoxin system RelE/ParE family toxin [Thermoanaerobaculia bacterium]|nr:type II toxin-antitoxin system RelE/ParE family toxin [Thermoanaerobaculia bacterium]
MSWRVEYTRIFLRELAHLPTDVRQRAEKIAFSEDFATGPAALGRIQKLQGYKDKYRIRIGDYRVGVEISYADKLIVFRRIAHRREIYRVFP